MKYVLQCVKDFQDMNKKDNVMKVNLNSIVIFLMSSVVKAIVRRHKNKKKDKDEKDE